MNGNHPSLSEVGDRVREDLDLLHEAVQRQTDQLRQKATGFIHEHPYSAVGAAFGIGFLLSGGLFSKATVRTLSFGTRFFVGRLMRQLFAGAGAGLLFPTELSHRGETRR
jgi:hypothetical protein